MSGLTARRPWQGLFVAALVCCASCKPETVNARDLVDRREVRIAADSGLVLAGTFALPHSPLLSLSASVSASPSPSQSEARITTVAVTEAALPAVLLLSGSGPQDRDGARVELPGYAPFREIADTLVHHGIAVLRLDDRGVGASGGQFAGATTYDFANDARAAIRWLRAQPSIDRQRITLIGHSEGALVALLVAADDRDLAGIILLGASARTGRALARWQRQALVLGDENTFPSRERGAVLAVADSAAEHTAQADPWMRTWFSLDPQAVAARVHVPSLLLHGENDRQVPVADAALLADALRLNALGSGALHANSLRADGTADVVVHRFAATNHLLLEDFDGDPRGYVRLENRHVRGDVLRVITDWMTSHRHETSSLH